MTTIENTFLVVDRASGPLRGIKREARDLRTEAERAGKAMDGLAGGGREKGLIGQAAAAADLRGELGGVRRELMLMAPTLRAHERHLRDAEVRTRALRKETDLLSVSLQRLGTQRATAEARVSGVGESLAEVRALRAELNSLGRMRSRATAATTTTSVGGGRGGGRAFGGGGFGFRGMGAGSLAAVAGVGLPAVQSLVIGGAGVLGSAGAGALGAGAVGGAGLGLGIAGIGGTTASLVQANAALETATKAQDAYNQSILEYGIGSAQAKKAKEELDRQMEAGGPGMRQAIREMREFNREYRALTQSGRMSAYGMRADIARAGQRVAPQLASAQNRTTAASRGALQSQLGFLTSEEPMGALGTLTNTWVGELPQAERSLQNIERSVIRIGQASLPYVRELNDEISLVTAGWERATRNEEKLSAGIGGLVDDTKAWAGLLGASWDLIRDIGNSGRGSGRGLVDDLTATVERWDRWVTDNPRQLEQRFDDAADGVVRIANATGDLVSLLDRAATSLQPVLTGFTSLVSLAERLGVVGTPGLIAAGMGAAGALRGGAGAAAGGAAGGGAGIGGLAAGAEVGLAGGVAATGIGQWYSGRRATRATTAAWRASVAEHERLKALQGRNNPLLLRQQIGAAAAQRTAAAQAMYDARAAATPFGAGAGSTGGALLGGAAKRFLPIGVGFGLLDAYGFDGSFGERAQVFGSTLTMGAIARPRTSAQRADQAARLTDDFASQMVDGRSGWGGVAAYDAEIARLQATGLNERGRLGGAANALVNVSSLGTDWGMSEADKARAYGTSKDQVRLNRERIRLLQAERDELAATNREMQARRDEALGRVSEQRGGVFAGKIGGLYDTYLKGSDQATAAGRTAGDINRRIRGSRLEGAEVIGEAGLQWAQEMAKENPKLQSVVDRITSQIKSKFRAMGRDVQIVNGDILTGTSREWEQIGVAITDPLERAAQKAKRGFTEIQQAAIGSLVAMGYSRREAQSLVRDVQAGGKRERDAMNQVDGAVNRVGAAPSGRMGGRTGPSAQEMRMSRTGDGHGHAHGDGMGNGGRSRLAAAQRAGTSGNLMGAKPGLSIYAQVAEGMGLRVSSGARPGAITSTGGKSYHSSGDALDLAGPPDAMLRFAKYAAQAWGSHLEELIYTPMGAGIKNGQPFTFSGSVASNHYDHVHIADTDPSAAGSVPGGVSAGLSMDTAGPGLMSVQLSGSRSGIAGAPGALADAATGAYAAGLQAKVNAAIGGGGPDGGGSGSFTADSLARLWAAVNPGIGDPRLMGAIGMAESSGNPHAIGIPTSGGRARGLWQIMWPLHAGRFPGMNPEDPDDNAKMAGVILQDQGLGAWEAYTRGMHTRFMGDGHGHDGQSTTVRAPERVAFSPQPRSSGGGQPIVFGPGSFQLSVAAGGGMSQQAFRAQAEPLFVEFAERLAALVAGRGLESEKELMA